MDTRPEVELTTEDFIRRFLRNYVNYAALVQVAFTGGDDCFAAYQQLSEDSRREILEIAKQYAASA